MFRLINQTLNCDNIDYTRYVMSVVIDDKKDFNRAINGFKVNGVTFKRFVGTTGGLKNNSVIFINAEILDELNERCNLPKDKNIKMIPAKYEAYKALTCSSSQEIINPKEILVVKDVIINYEDTVLYLDDTDKDGTPKNERKRVPTITKESMVLENNGSDGFNLCSIEFMKKVSDKLGLSYISSGVCLRNKWLKGMMYPFPIKEFVKERNNGNGIVKDIWGNEKDLNNVELILTESSLKLWSAYNSIEDYMLDYKNSGYEFSVTKIVSDNIESERELNYQYLQSFEFSDEDIEELCKPTIDFLKSSMGDDCNSVLKFLGVNENYKDNDWKKALYLNNEMINDPYIIDCIHRYIKKKIDNAKIGKLINSGNFQVFSNDPICLMESICGLNINGILKENECYSSYWNNIDNTNEILAFRSPMSNHNNIRKLKIIDNGETKKWYRYMKNILDRKSVV